MALNQWVGIGRLTKDIEVKNTQDGKPVASFQIAIDRPYTAKDGKRPTDFLTVVAWDKKATFASQYFRQGDPIQIVGRIETRRYKDKNGNDRTAVEVNAESVGFVEGYKRAAEVARDQKPSNDWEEVGEDDLPF